MNETLLSGVDEQTTSQSSIDLNKDYLAELVGEGKKFKTDKDLARGKYEADLYVKTLERQQDELRADYLKLREDSNARAKLEELIGQLEAKQSMQHSNSEQPKATEVKDKPGIDPKDIESLVSSKIHEFELTKKQTDNFNTVKNKLKEELGDNYQEILKSRIASLDLTEEDINALAKKSPAAFYKAIGIDKSGQKETFQTPFTNTQRNFQPKGSEKRTRSYYLNMKKSDPKRYLDPKTNVEMHNDAVEQGEAFFDVDG